MVYSLLTRTTNEKIGTINVIVRWDTRLFAHPLIVLFVRIFCWLFEKREFFSATCASNKSEFNSRNTMGITLFLQYTYERRPITHCLTS